MQGAKRKPDQPEHVPAREPPSDAGPAFELQAARLHDDDRVAPLGLDEKPFDAGADDDPADVEVVLDAGTRRSRAGVPRHIVAGRPKDANESGPNTTTSATRPPSIRSASSASGR